MIEKILLLIIILYLIGTCIYRHYQNKKYEQLSIKESINLIGNPIIMLENNGHTLNFILDTGANKSVIDSSILKDCVYKNLDTKTTNIGIDGIESTLSNVVLDLKGRKSTYTELFNVTDLSSVIKFVKESSGITIHGLIGTPFLTKYKYVIDFEELIIYSKKKWYI